MIVDLCNLLMRFLHYRKQIKTWSTVYGIPEHIKRILLRYGTHSESLETAVDSALIEISNLASLLFEESEKDAYYQMCIRELKWYQESLHAISFLREAGVSMTAIRLLQRFGGIGNCVETTFQSSFKVIEKKMKEEKNEKRLSYLKQSNEILYKEYHLLIETKKELQ